MDGWTNFLPPFEPPSIVAARSEIAMRLSWMTAVMGLGLFMIDWVAGVPARADSMMTLVLALTGALSWVLLKTRHDTSVAWLLVAFLFGMAASSTWFFWPVPHQPHADLCAVGPHGGRSWT